MVFNRSKYLRRGEGPHRKEVSQGTVTVGSRGGGGCTSLNFTRISPLWPPNPSPRQAPAWVMPCQIFIVWSSGASSPWLMERPRREGDWGVVIGQATGDSTLVCIPERTRWAILHIF